MSEFVEPTTPEGPTRAWSVRTIIALAGGVAFLFIAFAGIALSLRVVPSATAIARRSESARIDYSRRTQLAAALDSALTEGWTLLRQSRLAPVPAEKLDAQRMTLERIVRGTSLLEPLRRDEHLSVEFVAGLERADEAAARMAAMLLGVVGAIDLRDTVTAAQLLSVADSLDSPLSTALNEVTAAAMSDLSRDERRLEVDARFASRLLWVWLLIGLVVAPLLWRLLHRRLVGPLAAFEQALQRVDRGDLDVELPVPIDDELGRLAAHFNRTTQVLRTQRQEGEMAAAQAALEASEARYRSAFESAAVGLAEIGLDGTILQVNRAACALLAREPEALLGRIFLEFTHPDETDRLRAEWPERLAHGIDIVREERRYLRPDGSTATAQVTATIMRQSDGTPRHVLAVLHDVTEQRRLERELLQAMKLEAVGQLAGGVAHDFNNILTGIIGYADLLEDDDGHAASVREDAIAIRNAALRGAELSRSLLTLARRNTHRAEPFALAPVLQETAELARRTFDKRLDVRCILEAAPVILGDRSLVGNALLNLAVNARDAMPEGGTLTLTTRAATVDAAFRRRHALPLDGPVAMIEVRDSGAGMTAEVLSHVFEPFFTTKAPGKGTGLGLAMVYGTVKDHRGAIAIESEPGRGTVVTIHLPCASVTAGDELTPTLPVRAVVSARVLLVDDDLLVREVAGRMLTRLGYTVEHAEDGIVALERLAVPEHGIALVIMDGNMPRLNGIETARRVHATHPTLPMIYASGHFDAAVHEDLDRIGFRERLVKPYSLDALSRAVARCLEPSAAR